MDWIGREGKEAREGAGPDQICSKAPKYYMKPVLGIN